MTLHTTKEILLEALVKNDLTVQSSTDEMIVLNGNYTIEIENESLFKLKQKEFVIAPFDDIHEMCQFIKMDIQLNEES
ncbi:MAG: hypothetical protein AAGA77_15475 [Bacteroidota bacterium]